MGRLLPNHWNVLGACLCKSHLFDKAWRWHSSNKIQSTWITLNNHNPWDNPWSMRFPYLCCWWPVSLPGGDCMLADLGGQPLGGICRAASKSHQSFVPRWAVGNPLLQRPRLIACHCAKVGWYGHIQACYDGNTIYGLHIDNYQHLLYQHLSTHASICFYGISQQASRDSQGSSAGCDFAGELGTTWIHRSGSHHWS